MHNVGTDRTKLWEHVGKALETALAKVQDDDLEQLASLCFESVQADMGVVAALPAVLSLLEDFARWPRGQRLAYLAYLRANLYPVVVHGRARWEQVKSEEIEL